MRDQSAPSQVLRGRVTGLLQAGLELNAATFWFWQGRITPAKSGTSPLF